MHAKIMKIEPRPIETDDNLVTRSCSIIYSDNGQVINKKTLWFKGGEELKKFNQEDCDAYLLAMLFDAMQEGRQLIIKGSVSRQLLINLTEYQAAWNKWLPDTYSLVDIEVDNIRDVDALVEGAVCAFSGGVDATFSVWRHSQNKIKFGSYSINRCVFVHGFDIPITDKDAFQRSSKRSIDTLKDINIDLVAVSTNYREISMSKWEHSHACALVAALSNLKSIAGICIVGSTEPYDSLVIPWGSSPITDHLLSSNDFKVVHDGASHTRTEKVVEISDWNKGLENLRVCWEGDVLDRNCGKCEKCLRTMMNFVASNHAVPSCFPDTVDIKHEIKNLLLRNDVARAYWRDIFDYGSRHGLESGWLKLIKEVVERKSWDQYILPIGSRRREFIKTIARRGNRNTETD